MVVVAVDGGADEGTGRGGDEVSGVQGTEVRGSRLRRSRGRGVVSGGDGGITGVELGMVVQMEGMVRGESG